jgi:hypothetical protein
MNKHFTSKLLGINKYIFPVLVTITYLFLLIESYKYSGFISKHIFIDSTYFLVVTLISAILLIGKEQNVIEVLFFKFNKFVILPVCVLIYLIMQLLESFHYNNYVFSTYHLQPSNFFYIVVFSSILGIVGKLINNKVQKLQFIVMVLPLLFISNITKVVDSAIASDVFVLSHLNYSYSDKLRNSWGIYYDYMEFIKKNTPEDSSILLPPKAYPWFLTGNIEFSRYFLFPRTLINGNEKDPRVSLDSVDYVLIDYGESQITQFGYTNIWPKFDIDGEYIIYWNPKDGSTKRSDTGKYSYSAQDNTNWWGIVKLK